MKPIADVVNGILGVKSFKSDIQIRVIRSVVHNTKGRWVVFTTGDQYSLDGWSEDNICAFEPGGCLLSTPDGSETVCSKYFVENFLQ